MNTLKGVITGIETAGSISVVQLDVEGDHFTSVVMDTPATAAYMNTGEPVMVFFKETEVIIGKEFSGKLSARNRFTAVITGIETGSILSRIMMRYREFPLSSIITTRAVQDLNLNVGDDITAFVKSNELSLMEWIR